MNIRYLLLSLIPIISSCSNLKKEASFEAEHIKWQEERIERLKSKNGWLNLAGLFWLSEGENTIGSDSSNNIIFPENAPPRLGKYIIQGNEILYIPETGPEMKIMTDQSGDATLLESGSLAWFIIERSGKYAIRLRDYEHPSIESFHGIESYPPDLKWKIKADFEKFSEPYELLIPTVMGTTEKSLCPGILRFRIDGKEQVLYPSRSGKGFFIVFADETSGDETYGGGRFLYTGEPGRDGSLIIDFNRAYNPPCAFTPFATCPVPPRENLMTVPVQAGEKFAGH